MSAQLREPGSPRCSAPRGEGGGWHRHPLTWLGGLIFLASLAGCVWLIVMAQRYPDPVLDEVGMKILRMPLEAAPARAPAPQR